jgi:hypothetical protein
MLFIICWYLALDRGLLCSGVIINYMSYFLSFHDLILTYVDWLYIYKLVFVLLYYIVPTHYVDGFVVCIVRLRTKATEFIFCLICSLYSNLRYYVCFRRLWSPTIILVWCTLIFVGGGGKGVLVGVNLLLGFSIMSYTALCVSVKLSFNCMFCLVVSYMWNFSYIFNFWLSILFWTFALFALHIYVDTPHIAAGTLNSNYICRWYFSLLSSGVLYYSLFKMIFPHRYF